MTTPNPRIPTHKQLSEAGTWNRLVPNIEPGTTASERVKQMLPAHHEHVGLMEPDSFRVEYSEDDENWRVNTGDYATTFVSQHFTPTGLSREIPRWARDKLDLLIRHQEAWDKANALRAQADEIILASNLEIIGIDKGEIVGSVAYCNGVVINQQTPGHVVNINSVGGRSAYNTAVRVEEHLNIAREIARLSLTTPRQLYKTLKPVPVHMNDDDYDDQDPFVDE